MTKIIVTTDNAPKSMAFSQGVKAGGLVFVAGQGLLTPIQVKWLVQPSKSKLLSV